MKSVFIPCNLANIYMHSQWIASDVGDLNCLHALWLSHRGLAAFHDGKYHITVSISSKAKIFVRINFASFASQASRQLDKQDYLWSTYIDQTLQQNASLSGLSVKVLSWRWKLLHLVEISRHSSYPRGNLTSTISKSKVDSSQVQLFMPRCHIVFQILYTSSMPN